MSSLSKRNGLNTRSQATPSVKKQDKKTQLEAFTVATGPELTNNQGLQIPDNHNSLKAGDSGPTLLEDFILREKISHFGQERIPERVVNARGCGAHGYFKAYKSMVQYTSAVFLQDPELETPVFVRFSTSAGSQGSADTVRDVRGFAVKFYTQDGNYDLVGNNMPVFFIQDAIKFPDLIHALKPEPNHEMPASHECARYLLGFCFADARSNPYAYVDHVRSRVATQLAHDGRIWRSRFSFYQCAGRCFLCEVSLETQIGRAWHDMGRGPENCWKRS